MIPEKEVIDLNAIKPGDSIIAQTGYKNLRETEVISVNVKDNRVEVDCWWQESYDTWSVHLVDIVSHIPAQKITEHDAVNHPSHYTSHPSGIEAITVTEHMNFCIGNAVKYLWRAGLKGESHVEDLKKAAWYINREISRLEGEKK